VNHLDPTYGSDKDGLVWGYFFVPGEPARPVDAEPAALFRLLSRPPEWIADEDLQDLRQAAEEFSTAVVDSGALVERIKLLQEELAANVGEQTSRTLFVLTMVTVLALPVNLIAGLFGMNVGGVPLAAHRHGFLLVVSGLLALTALLAYLAFRRWRE
jgi:zinc transporter